MKKKLFVIVIVICAILLGGLACYILTGKSLKGMSLAYVEMGRQCLEQRNYLKATAYFNRAIALDQESFFARIFLPKAYLLAGHYELALEEYQTTLELAERQKWNESEIRLLKANIEEIKKRIETGKQ